MDFKDLFITPLFLVIFIIGALIARPFYTNSITRKYFMPALLLKFFGAISLGLVFQFYYGGGDTFNYFTYGSRWIWEAFLDSPAKGLKLILYDSSIHYNDTFQYSERIWYYKDPHSYMIVRLTGFFDIFTLHTYSATALFFSLFSFIGSWSLFNTFAKLYNRETKWLAISILFIPSVIFWGSGILKDSVTFGALGLATFALFNIFLFKKKMIKNFLILGISLWIIFSIKIYILMTFVVGAGIWLYSINIAYIKSTLIRVVVAPFILIVFAFIGYQALQSISSNDNRYALDNVAKTAAVTANDIRYGWGARNGDTSGYDLGELDGTIGSLIRLAPAAINVSLFRPYLWEVKNPLMLLAALESGVMFFITMYFLYKGRNNIRLMFKDPQLRFCLFFSLLFAFAVGVSTFNFGTLMRYKIPMMPFYAIFLVILSQNTTFKRNKN